MAQAERHEVKNSERRTDKCWYSPREQFKFHRRPEAQRHLRPKTTRGQEQGDRREREGAQEESAPRLPTSVYALDTSKAR